MADLDRISINTITNKPLTFEQVCHLYPKHEVYAFTPWHEQVDAVGVSAARELVAERGLTVTSLCLCGLFSNEGRENRAKVLDQNRRRLDMAAELGAPYATMVPGGLLPGSKSLVDTLAYNYEATAELLEHAREVGVQLCLEPLHPLYAPDWGGVNDLKTANDWCDRLGEGMGVAVDTYHVWWDPNLEQEIMRAGKAGRLLSYCVGDFMVPTADTLCDRGLPGEGIIDIKTITQWMSAAGYTGPIEVELFSTRWWSCDQSVFLDELTRRFAEFV